MKKADNFMKLPFWISNAPGEKLTFLKISKNDKGEDVIEMEAEVPPKLGPPMHVHYKQAESITVLKGKMGYQVLGESEKFLTEGETVEWKAGVAHKFWNAGDETLHCTAWVAPMDNYVYFLSQIYRSINENNGWPSMFDAAFLMNRYKSEMYMYEVPAFVQKVIFPILLFIGKPMGKYKKFAGAPEPIV